MALSATLGRMHLTPERLEVRAVVSLDRDEGGYRVTSVDLQVKGQVPDIDQQTFESAAQKAEEGCPISNALRGNVKITVHPTLDKS
jgi:osmotically inducible protein OsmC